jgi:predicted DNA binding protein
MADDPIDNADWLRHAVVADRIKIATLELAIRRLAEQDATLSVCDGNVTVTLDATLTDEEREAIREACDEGRWYPKDYHHIHTLRCLLERLF